MFFLCLLTAYFRLSSVTHGITSMASYHITINITSLFFLSRDVMTILCFSPWFLWKIYHEWINRQMACIKTLRQSNIYVDLVLLLLWAGQKIWGQNCCILKNTKIWRNWMVSHNYYSYDVHSKQNWHGINWQVLRICQMCSVIIGYKIGGAMTIQNFGSNEP